MLPTGMMLGGVSREMAVTGLVQQVVKRTMSSSVVRAVTMKTRVPPPIARQAQRTMLSQPLLDRVQSLAENASVEISPQTVREFVETVDAWDVDPRLAARRTVFVNMLVPELDHFAAVRRATRVLSEAGHEAVPHVPASVVGNEPTAERVLEELAEAGANSVLVVGGNQLNRAATLTTQRLGEVAARYFDRVVFPTFPEGHPQTNDDATKVLDRKLRRVQQKKGVVTQWTSNSRITSRWLTDFLKTHHDARVYVGVAGPCPRPNFERFAQFCGVRIPPPKAIDVDVFHKPTRAVTALAADLEALHLDHDRAHLHLFSLKVSRTLDFLHRLSAGVITQPGTLLAA